ncbi:MAG TPA: hypothetical protein VHD56_15310 [Tepidisphaeraceae bacterium]|nr:hypothetical protein [Tepidisphaeraceae bacterium]
MLNRFLSHASVVMAGTCICISLASAQTSSDPKSALKNLHAAFEKADAPAIQQFLYVENDPQQELARGYAGVVVAGKRLADGAKKKFPGSAVPFTQGTTLPEDAAQIDAAEVSINDDTATLKIPGQPVPQTLRMIEGSWKLIVPTGTAHTDEERTRMLKLLKALTDAMNLSADEINDNKYTTVQDAEAAVKQRLGAVWSKALQTDAPTSAPTTQMR